MKGRNAAKAFNETRAARFAGARAERDALRQAEIEAGLRRELVMVDLADVEPSDLVLTQSDGFVLVGDTTPDAWHVTDGRTVVKRFRTV